MQIVVNNIARQQEIDPIAIGFKQRVLSKMKLQIKKKIGMLGSGRVRSGVVRRGKQRYGMDFSKIEVMPGEVRNAEVW